MTAAQVAAQMAVEAANNQKSRCELGVHSVGLWETIYVSWAFSLYVCMFDCVCTYHSKAYSHKTNKQFSKDGIAVFFFFFLGVQIPKGQNPSVQRFVQ